MPSIAATAWISRVGRGEEGLARGAQVVDRPGALLDVERLDQAVAGDRLEDPVVERRRAQGALRGDPEDRGGRRLQHDAVGRTSTASSAPWALAIRVACMLAA